MCKKWEWVEDVFINPLGHDFILLALTGRSVGRRRRRGWRTSCRTAWGPRRRPGGRWRWRRSRRRGRRGRWARRPSSCTAARGSPCWRSDRRGRWRTGGPAWSSSCRRCAPRRRRSGGRRPRPPSPGRGRWSAGRRRWPVCGRRLLAERRQFLIWKAETENQFDVRRIFWMLSQNCKIWKLLAYS